VDERNWRAEFTEHTEKRDKLQTGKEVDFLNCRGLDFLLLRVACGQAGQLLRLFISLCVL
jgi:hypothetical protein